MRERRVEIKTSAPDFRIRNSNCLALAEMRCIVSSWHIAMKTSVHMLSGVGVDRKRSACSQIDANGPGSCSEYLLERQLSQRAFATRSRRDYGSDQSAFKAFSAFPLGRPCARRANGQGLDIKSPSSPRSSAGASLAHRGHRATENASEYAVDQSIPVTDLTSVSIAKKLRRSLQFCCLTVTSQETAKLERSV